MFIPRNLLEPLVQLKDKYPILAVTGPRQSGKTTLLRESFPDYEYVSLENADIRERAMQDPNAFLEKYAGKVIFDEVQRVPQLFSYLQTKTDLDKVMGQYILSGSQNFLLLKNISQSLAGRVALFKLLPFSFSELHAEGLLAASWQEAAFKGFYPTIYDRQLTAPEFYPNYLETYVERDVRNLLSIRDLRQFRLFIKRCAGHAGHLLNLLSLANDCGISPPTAKAWLSVLESSYIVFTLSPYYRNFNKRIVKTPKLFFYDTGLVCNLLEMDSPRDVDNYFQRGSLFENFIIAEMYKQTFHQGRRPSFYFWQDSNKSEVDLLWEKASAIHLMEIKSGQTVNASFFKNLEKFTALSEQPTTKQYLVYGGTEHFNQKGTKVLGWQAVQELE
jgi:uncharacterized protein